MLGCPYHKRRVKSSTGCPYSPVDIGLNPGKIRTKLENGSYDAEFHWE